jgi:hypothetical protein
MSCTWLDYTPNGEITHYAKFDVFSVVRLCEIGTDAASTEPTEFLCLPRRL